MRADQPVYANSPLRVYVCGITGTGAADPTKRYGDGITVTRTSAGVYRFSFNTGHPGYRRGWSAGLEADTPSALKNYMVTRAPYVAPSGSTAGYVEVSVWNGSGTATDLAALQYLDVEFRFSEISTS